MQKYEFTGETKWHYGRTLHRICRLLDGRVGGWIEREGNLSHEGDCWVDEEAMVFNDALVSGDAWVYGNAWVLGRAWVYGHARVFRNAWVYGDARVSRCARVGGDARVFDAAIVSGNARVLGRAWVRGDIRVIGRARVCGDAWLGGHAQYTEHYSTTPTVLYGPNWDVVQHPSSQISIGCEKHPLGYWLENYRGIGVEHALTDDLIEEYGELLHSLKAA